MKPLIWKQDVGNVSYWYKVLQNTSNSLPNCSLEYLNNWKTIYKSVSCTPNYYSACNDRCILKYEFSAIDLSATEVDRWTYGVIFPILVVITIITNILVLLILSQKHMRSPTNMVLLYMAVAELFVGIIPLPYTVYHYSLQQYDSLLVTKCYMVQYLFNTFPTTCHQIAMWLTVLLAAQRFVYIQFPLRSQSWCTLKNVKICSTVILVISLVWTLPKLMDTVMEEVFHDYRLIETSKPNSSVTLLHWNYHKTCFYKHTPLLTALGLKTYYNIYFWSRALCFSFIPAILLIILNALLIRGIRKAQARKERLLQENRRREARRMNDTTSTSTMLVVIVTVFLIVNLPQGAFLILVCIDSTFELGIMQQKSMVTFQSYFLAIDNMLIIATYPLNFAIYCSMSSTFRESFQRLFCARGQAFVQQSRCTVRSSLARLRSGRSHFSSNNDNEQSAMHGTHNHSNDTSAAPSSVVNVVCGKEQCGLVDNGETDALLKSCDRTPIHQNQLNGEKHQLVYSNNTSDANLSNDQPGDKLTISFEGNSHKETFL